VSAACNFDGCTVGETGSCALERDPATCEHRVGAVAIEVPGSEDGTDVTGDTGVIGAPVLERPSSTASFPSSHTLGPDMVSDLMASRYVTVVGILGDPDSGKTACLASLYLLVANAQLTGWKFADSRSLMAFEDISRGARDWNTGLAPEQMTVHTEMSDERRPGFLHLRLVRESDGRRVDLALPDLPGEWTTKLVSSAQAERFGFMKSAEALWVVVDGRALADNERRQGVISRVGQLAERLKTLFGRALPRLMVVITHRDDGEITTAVSTRLASELSDHAEVRAGFGLDDLMTATVGTPRANPEFWPAVAPREGARSFLGYRRDQ
jgi:hypothetical protein